MCSGSVENWEHETSCTFVEDMEEGAPIAEVLNLSGFVETVCIFVRWCVAVAKDYEEKIADYPKCVTGVSSAFQVVAMCVVKAETRMDMNRKMREADKIH